MSELALSPPRDGLDRTFAVFGCLCIFLAFSLASYSAVFNLDLRIGREEGDLREAVTAACLFLASLLLFVLAKMEKVRIRRCAYLLGGLAMAVGCGEELSWGQHIFGFSPPDFLVRFHSKKELNIHNIVIVQSYLRYTLAMVPLLLCIVACTACFCRKDHICGIPLPSAPLMLSFLLVIYPEYTLTGTRLWSILSGPGVLLLSFFIFSLFSKQVRLCIFTAALMTMPAAALYANFRCDCYAWYTDDETLECLLALAYLLYAAELWRAKGGGSAASWRPLRRLAAGLKAPVRRLPPPWLMVSALMAAGSSGLAVSGHLASRTTADAFAEDLRRIMAVEPVARSEFDVHLMEDSLIYSKEPCMFKDLSPPFFLHVYLADRNELPRHRIIHGFDNLDFHALQRRAVMSEGKCMVKRQLRLPNNRAGARIATGQWWPHEGRTLWRAEFPLNQWPELP